MVFPSPVRLVALVCLTLLAVSSLGAAFTAHTPTTPNDEQRSPGEAIRAEVHRAADLLGIKPASMPMQPCPPLDVALHQHFVYMDAALPPEPPTLRHAGLEQAIACVLDAQLAANLVRDEAIRHLDLQALAPLLVSDDPAFHDGVPEVDLAVALGAALQLAERIDNLLVVMNDVRDATPDIAADAPTAPPEFDLEPVLAIDRLGPTLYDKDYALIIDTAGNDLYDNNAGGGMIAFGGGPLIPPTGNSSSWQHTVAPLGEGSPHIVVGGQFEDSEVILSAAIALDNDGDDTYGVYRDAGRDGVCTDEQIVRRVLIQGAAVLGPSMLIDTAGDNSLHARVLGQGMGHLGGVGVLYLGPGNDTLHAVRSSQGSGVFEGVGILIDEGGDDTYVSRVPEGGTFNADLGFCDKTSRYTQGSGFGRVTGGGSGVVGILRDEAGDDHYETDLKGQGFGMVFGVGVLEDIDGDDTYVAETKAMGYGEGHAGTSGFSVGILYDAAGNDQYQLAEAPGIGMGAGGLPSGHVPAPYLPPTLWANEVIRENVNPLLATSGGIMWDRGGTDSYSLGSRGDGGIDAQSSFVGVFLDEA